MRLSRLTWPLILTIAVACSSVSCGPENGTTAGGEPARDSASEASTRADSDRAAAAEAERVAARGVVRGVVRSALTGDPLSKVYVSADELGASTDDHGEYVVPLLTPGPVTLQAYRRGFVPDSSAVLIEAGKVTYADLSLAPAPPPCCTLEGNWTARFELDSAGLNSRPAARRLEGRLVIGAEIAGATGEPTGVGLSSGSSDLDFGPVLGGDVRGAVDDLEAAVFAGDSVAVTLLPRFGDWAIELRGRVAGDSVVGTWFQRASCCGAYGSFVLVR